MGVGQLKSINVETTGSLQYFIARVTFDIEQEFIPWRIKQPINLISSQRIELQGTRLLSPLRDRR